MIHYEEAAYGARHLVVHPQTTHGVVHGRVDAHRNLVGVFVRDALVHFEKIAVTLADCLLAQARDGLGEVEIDAESGLPYAVALIAQSLGVAGGDVARDKIAEAGVATLQVVVTLFFGYLIGRTRVALLFRDPDAAVVA